MRVPVMQGIIDRRILANYRIQPEVLRDLLPAPFRPKLVRGYAVGGICLIRLKQLRPRWMPVPCGFSSENAAHRFAVEWDEGGEQHEGVYIPRRDTDSRWNTLLGGRLFPGVHHHAKFSVVETAERLSIALTADDDATHVEVKARVTDRWPSTSVFRDVHEASAFFEAGSLGYSATDDPGRFDGLELQCHRWQVQSLAVEHVASSYFDNTSVFPIGSIVFDCALLMRGIEHAWQSRADLCCTGAEAGALCPTS